MLPPVRRSRSHLVKGVRTLYRSASSRVVSGSKGRGRDLPRAALVVLIVLVLVGIGLRAGGASPHLGSAKPRPGHEHPKPGSTREELHFTEIKHDVLPKQRSFESTPLEPCSWVYLEVNAFDGRDVRDFFVNASGVFEESLRAELAPSRAWCTAAFEADLSNAEALFDVREDRGVFAKRFDVFPGLSVGNAFPGASHGADDRADVQILDLIERMTLPLAQSGQHEDSDMIVSLSNGQRGSVIVRISGSYGELYSHADTLMSSTLLCERVDRLVLNVTTDMRDPGVAPHYSPSSERFSPALGLPGLVKLGEDLEALKECRARLFVLDDEGSLVFPPPLGEREILYSVLAGAPTFNERVYAQTDTWVRGLPMESVVYFTNEKREGSSLTAAQGRDVVFVQPAKPELEQRLAWMQSWSHLVRVRESWERYMRVSSDIKWLALVDDDTFVFPAGIREYFAMIDHRKPVWGGSGELARIDNGDRGEFAHWLRDLSKSHGGKHCYMSNETVPEQYRGSHHELIRSDTMSGRKAMTTVSHMCQDHFCRRGCPAVPQGAAIFLSRALVESLVDSVEGCEAMTSHLCERCGSQRLYLCANKRVKELRTLLTRGVCRSPWKLEPRRNFPIALTYHAFGKHGRLTSSTGSIHGDMAQLWQLGELYEDRGPWEGTVPMSEVANLLGCNGEGEYIHETKSCRPIEVTED